MAIQQTYLHVGLPRTGTLAVQSWLARHEVSLRPLSAVAFSQPLAHRLAVEAVTSSSRRAEADICEIMQSPLQKAHSLFRQAAASGVQFIFVSSQYFCLGDPLLVKEQFSALGVDQMKIVFVLRRQDRFVEQEYAHAVSMLGRKEPIPDLRYRKDLNWCELVSPWAQVFGSENVALHAYDEILASGKSLPFAVFHSTDASIAELAAQEAASTEAFPAALLEFQRLANVAGVTGRLAVLDAARARGIGGPPFRLDPLKASQILDLYRESNRELARNLLGRDNLFDESDLKTKPTGADYTGKLPLDTLAKLFALHLAEEIKKDTLPPKVVS